MSAADDLGRVAEAMREALRRQAENTVAAAREAQDRLIDQAKKDR